MSDAPVTEAPLFVQSYDLYCWLLDRMEAASGHAPLRRIIVDQSRRLLDALTLALRRFDAVERAREADELATTLRVHVRVARDKHLLDDEQLLFAAERLDSIGKQLGGWRKRLDGVGGAGCLRDQPFAPCAAAPGTTTLGTSPPPIATGTGPRTGTRTRASAALGRRPPRTRSLRHRCLPGPCRRCPGRALGPARSCLARSFQYAAPAAHRPAGLSSSPRSMRTYAVPLEQVATPMALLAAWRLYRSGKRLRPEVALVEMDHERVVLELSRELLAGRYVHRPYRVLRITDPKPRLIAVATVRDRLVHTSIHRALAPFYNRSFIDDSYACLPERGSHRAVLRFVELFRRYGHVMHLDVRRYFPSVDHGILRALVLSRLRDRRWDRLIDAILASGRALYARPEVRDFYGHPPNLDRPRGLPIGNLTSQWWGNLYLDGLDHFAKRRLGVGGYLRYMDDVVLFADEPATLRGWRTEIGRWLRDERLLELNPSKGHVHATSLPHTYLGYRVTRAGYDLAPVPARRFRQGLPRLMREDPQRIHRTLAAWKGAMAF